MKFYSTLKPNLKFVATFLCAALLSQTAMAEPAAPRQYVDGSVTAQQIQAKLQSEGFSPLTKINASAQDDGTVTLKGIAVSEAEVARAINLAKEVSGVTGVQSEILIKRIQ